MAKRIVTYQVQYSCVIEVEDDGPNWSRVDGLIIPPEAFNIDIPEGGANNSVYEENSFEVVDVTGYDE
jgi:hypothetical protein